MSGIPCLLAPDHSLQPLTPVGRRRDAAGSTSEAFLQRAIDASPALVPFGEFLPGARRIVSLGMEIPLAFPGGRTGYLDNLLLTDDGHLVVLEMKLWRNPEAIRQVVAQVLEYGLALSTMRPQDLEQVLHKCAHGQTRLAPDATLLDYAMQAFPDLDERQFAVALERHMRSGELLYLVAGDGIHASVEAIATWINARSGTPFHFGLLELDCYLTEQGGRFIVPRLLTKTKEIARHVVEVVVGGTHAALAQIAVDEQVSLPNGASRTARRDIHTDPASLTVDVLLARIGQATMAPGAQEFAVTLLNQLQEAAFDARSTRTELAFGIRDAGAPGAFVTLVSLQPDRLYLQYPHKRMGAEAALGFRRRANRIAPFFTPESLEYLDKQGRVPLGLMPLYSDLAGTGAALFEFLVQERAAIASELGLQAGT